MPVLTNRKTLRPYSLIIYITNNFFLYFGKKVPVRRTGAYRHKKPCNHNQLKHPFLTSHLLLIKLASNDKSEGRGMCIGSGTQIGTYEWKGLMEGSKRVH